MNYGIDLLFERYGPHYRWYVAVTGIIGVIIPYASATMAFVSLPDVQGAYGIGQDRAQWVATAWMAPLVVCFLISAKLSQAYGERLVFCISLLVFLVGCAFASTATNYDLYIFGRVLQGASAGIVQPMAMATTYKVFPPNHRGLAMGFFAMGMFLATATGPYLGGLVIDHYNWRLVYTPVILLCLVAIPAGVLFMPYHKKDLQPLNINWSGLALLTLAMLCLAWVMGNGQRFGWTSDVIVTASLIGALSATVFVYLQFRTKHPILDFTLLHTNQFSVAIILNVVFGIGFGVSILFYPVFVQEVQAYTATRAGLVIVPAGITFMIITLLAGESIDYVNERYLILTGVLIVGIATGMMYGADMNSSFWSIAILALLGRVGFGLILPAMDKLALQSLPIQQINNASGTINFFRQLGATVGMGVSTIIVETRTYFHIDALTALQTSNNAATQEYLLRLNHLMLKSGVPATLQQTSSLASDSYLAL